MMTKATTSIKRWWSKWQWASNDGERRTLNHDDDESDNKHQTMMMRARHRTTMMRVMDMNYDDGSVGRQWRYYSGGSWGVKGREDERTQISTFSLRSLNYLFLTSSQLPSKVMKFECNNKWEWGSQCSYNTHSVAQVFLTYVDSHKQAQPLHAKGGESRQKICLGICR